MASQGRIPRSLKRDLLYSLYSWGYYGVLFVSFFASSFILKNFLDGIREDDILVSAFPLNYPLYITIIIISTLLGTHFGDFDIKGTRTRNLRSSLLRTSYFKEFSNG